MRTRIPASMRTRETLQALIEMRLASPAGKAGNPIVRARLVQLAWRWVRFQPGSAITAWFRAKTAGGGGRAKRVAIVAVARKLAIALWRMATLGIVPEGARLRPAVAAAG